MNNLSDDFFVPEVKDICCDGFHVLSGHVLNGCSKAVDHSCVDTCKRFSRIFIVNNAELIYH